MVKYSFKTEICRKDGNDKIFYKSKTKYNIGQVDKFLTDNNTKYLTKF